MSMVGWGCGDVVIRLFGYLVIRSHHNKSRPEDPFSCDNLKPNINSEDQRPICDARGFRRKIADFRHVDGWLGMW